MNRDRREQWMQDVRDRQQNTTFPDTPRNEARFWRNLATSPWKTSTRIGMLILGAFVCIWIGIFVIAGFEAGPLVVLALVLGTLFLAGSGFAAIAWGTRRALKEAENSRHTKARSKPQA